MTPSVLAMGPSAADFLAERKRAHAKHHESSMEEMGPLDLNRLAVLLEELSEITAEVHTFGAGYATIVVPMVMSVGKIARILNEARHAAIRTMDNATLSGAQDSLRWALAVELCTLEQMLSEWAAEAGDQPGMAAMRREMIQLGAMTYAWRDAVLTRPEPPADPHTHHCTCNSVECRYAAIEIHGTGVAIIRQPGFTPATMRSAESELHSRNAEAQDE